MKRPRSEDELFRDLFLFVAVAKAMSFSGAAKDLHVSLSLLSRRVEAFERHLGVQLIKRTTRKLELTEVGSEYFERCQQLVEQIREVHNDLLETRTTPRGHLRVVMPGDCSLLLDALLLTRFTARHPEITLDIEVTSPQIDLAFCHFDVALWLGRLPDSSLVAHPLAQLTSHVYASPGYLARHREPVHPRDLMAHECVRLLGLQHHNTWSFHQGATLEDVQVSGRLALNHMGMINQLVAAGAGVGVIADRIASLNLQAGFLVKLLSSWSVTPLPVVALTSARSLPAKSRVFIEFLRQHLGDARQSQA